MSSFHFFKIHKRFKEHFGLHPHLSGQEGQNPKWGHMRQKSIIGSDNTSVDFSICAFLIGEMGVVPSPRDILKR